jgi:hypothetical protein
MSHQMVCILAMCGVTLEAVFMFTLPYLDYD